MPQREIDSYTRNNQRLTSLGHRLGVIIYVDDRDRAYTTTYDNLPFRRDSLDKISVRTRGPMKRPRNIEPGDFLIDGKYRKGNSKLVVELLPPAPIRPSVFEQISSYTARVFNKTIDGAPTTFAAPNKVNTGFIFSQNANFTREDPLGEKTKPTYDYPFGAYAKPTQKQAEAQAGQQQQPLDPNRRFTYDEVASFLAILLGLVKTKDTDPRTGENTVPGAGARDTGEHTYFYTNGTGETQGNTTGDDFDPDIPSNPAPEETEPSRTNPVPPPA